MSSTIPDRFQYDAISHRYWDCIDNVWIPVQFFERFQSKTDYNINKNVLQSEDNLIGLEKETKMLTFSDALIAVKQGKKIARTGWNGAGLTVWMVPAKNRQLPYLVIEYPENAKTTPGAICPWLASQTDLMAEDWTVV